MINLAEQILEVEYDINCPIVITDGPTSSINRNHCDRRDWISHDTFLPHMQRPTLIVRMSTGKVLYDSAQVLPCALEELGCETTSLDLNAYIWDYPDNCVFSVFRTEEMNMAKQKTKCHNISEPDSTNLASKSRTILKNIVECQRLFILPTMIPFM